MLIIIYKIEAMGLNLKDERIYLLLFGTPYIGAVLNLCMLVTFILGLFVTLVLQRWWATRMEYGLARTTSIELSYIVCTNLRGMKQRDAVDDVGRVMKSAREGIAAGRLGAVGLGEVEAEAVMVAEPDTVLVVVGV